MSKTHVIYGFPVPKNCADCVVNIHNREYYVVGIACEYLIAERGEGRGTRAWHTACADGTTSSKRCAGLFPVDFARGPRFVLLKTRGRSRREFHHQDETSLEIAGLLARVTRASAPGLKEIR